MANVKNGDLVRIEYTGRIASSGQVFETTSESVARQAGIYNTSDRYGPKLVVVGADSLIAGLEESIRACEVGKTAQFTISPEKAFGSKNPLRVRMLSEKEFAAQNVRAIPGMLLSLDGAAARVKSVTSGRVMVDFNHPLAGETVVYSLNVSEVLSDGKMKAEAILASMGVSGTVAQDAKGLQVQFAAGNDPKKLSAARQNLSSLVPGIKFKES